MAKYFFRNNGKPGTPARLADELALQAREEAFEDALKKAIRVVQALKGWRAYDASGNILGASDHTMFNIEAMDEALDVLSDQVDKLRGIKRVEIRPVIPELHFGTSKLLQAATDAVKYGPTLPKSEFAITPLQSQIAKSRGPKA